MQNNGGFVKFKLLSCYVFVRFILLNCYHIKLRLSGFFSSCFIVTFTNTIKNHWRFNRKNPM